MSVTAGKSWAKYGHTEGDVGENMPSEHRELDFVRRRRNDDERAAPDSRAGGRQMVSHRTPNVEFRAKARRRCSTRR